MPIQKSGKVDDLFINELQRLMPKTAETEAKVEDTPKEEQLEADRKSKGEKVPEGTTETQLPDAGERKDKPVQETFEGQLDKYRKESRAAAPNADKEGITENRLNEAEKTLYPHRNPKAHERTGDKRPVNALREEMGNASDAAKRERYEKANRSGEKRLVDKDVGSQLTNAKTEIKATSPTKEAFNFKQTKVAIIDACKEYIAYKDATEGNVKTAATDKFAEVKKLDALTTEILITAQTEERALTEDELAQISALKDRKSKLLLANGFDLRYPSFEK